MASVVALQSRMRLSDEPLAAKLAQLAARQHGVVSRGQLLELGMAGTTIRRWVAAGHLHRLHRGVYAVGHARIDKLGAWMAAVLACRNGSVLSHGPAGQLTGMINRRERLALHITLPSRTGGSPPGIVVHRPRNLDPRDTTRHHAIPTTTPTRTIWDLSSVLPSLQTRRAFEQAEKLNVLDRPRIAQLCEQAPSRRGTATIRTLLSERLLPLAETRSWLEDLLVQICRDNGLPFPAVNVPLLDYEVDFLWPDARFVVEADGGDHLRPRQRDKDNERDVALARAGYLIRRYSSRAMGDAAAVAGEVRDIIRERCLRGGAPGHR